MVMSLETCREERTVQTQFLINCSLKIVIFTSIWLICITTLSSLALKTSSSIQGKNRVYWYFNFFKNFSSVYGSWIKWRIHLLKINKIIYRFKDPEKNNSNNLGRIK